MYCQKCGTQNLDNVSFCSKCGSSLKPEIERKGITGKLGKMGVPGFRSGKTWKMVLATFGYFWIGLILLFAIGENSNTIPPSNTLITIDTSQMLPTINEMPDGTKKLSETSESMYAERSFGLPTVVTPQALKYEVYKYSSINEAIDKYNSLKNENSNYKLTDINLGNEGYGLEEANSLAKVVFRKANVVVIVKMAAPYVTTLSETKSYAKKVKI